MATGNWTLVNDTITRILQGVLKIGDNWAVALFTTAAASASSTTYSGLTGEVAAGGHLPHWRVSCHPRTRRNTASGVAEFPDEPELDRGSGRPGSRPGPSLRLDERLHSLAYALLDSGGATVTTAVGQTLTIAASPDSLIVNFS